ncbi:efflux RND transporter periplasmic adaptor subunit [Ferrimonas sp. SCSIO 43195]|uniref:efflux RND transporter periplasmic adaptor subunit n=1 Tax=Ferrimonas sp. SCSIO 43195 TaxID=2822844 RepID=UPI002075A021|nr:efflux RND transporter periplasmic adaptor subunit [Ferrimonas sp. SCSIO 43195]
MIRTQYRHWVYPVLALFLLMPALTAVVHAESHDHGAVAAQAGVYACPMHPEETGHKGDRCPKCNMFLTKVEAEYACPMHPQETGHKGDRCPKCNMFLTKVEAEYACPMHPQETGHKGDRCPICNMFLVAEEEEEATEHQGHDHSAMDKGSQPLASPATAAPTLIPVDSGPQGQVKYVCPMHPHIVSDEPGTCPICGMNLEKVDLGGSTEEVVVGVPGGMQQALGMRVQTIEQGTLWRYINTIGTVEYDQDAISHVHARVSGWIEKLGVASAGDEVKQGELLFELYSPDLVSAQDDFLLALDTLKRDKRRGGELIRKARLRLELLGMDSALIQALERSGQTLYRVPFYAQHDGVISELNVRDGMYIQPSTEVLKLVDLNRVWVIAEVFENQQGWFRQGQAAAVTASALGLFELDGNIDYIYPELDPVTRAMQVRVALANPEGKLKPGSLVDVELYGTAKRNLTLVPTEALIQTGRNNRVVVQQSDTEFVVKEVQLGMIAKGMAEVLSGVTPGDRVVVSGQFLLDSEASLKGSLMRMSNGASAGHNH